MFNLTLDELDNAVEAIKHHTYSVYFPSPLEWTDVLANWSAIRAHLASFDLDIYQPRPPLRTFAPKSRINLRPVALLHPYDLIIYTGLTLIARDDIEAARVPRGDKRLFSHRATPSLTTRLYESSTEAHAWLRATQRDRASRSRCRIVAVTDIADFFPRIYQHRLENIIRSVARSPRVTDVARVLVKKLLLAFSRGDSYGIPIGPLASSVLSEAVLIDVDAAMLDAGYDFVRWMDDYTFFCRSESEAQQALFALGEWLYEHHGLTLQPSKTKILRKASFLEGISRTYQERLQDRSASLQETWSTVWSLYGDESAVELSPEQLREIEALNLREMLDEAIGGEAGVDFQLAEFLIGTVARSPSIPTDNKKALVDLVLTRLVDLFPIVDSIARFIDNLDDLSAAECKKIGRELLKPLKLKGTPEYVAMWLLSVFASSDRWNHAATIRDLYDHANSEVVKRYAALALSASGTRQHVLSTRPGFDGGSPLLRTAILRAWHRLGSDERTHWKRVSVISDPLEKVI
ncbi:MAG: RNA-directed DNA polymerase [Vicinamibacteraceae bacterium]